ncbi:hypothetical protein PTSG_02815 [Salpingoeca rosetta]|uniref:alpha-L-fucosidase n=1 Tax=Salpingoeca rosetta (strain ATCC 50818 / BSB-021) TaxID=946362 RepID=F2U3E7_SALR5|nr:uncharacterized protein PTSG_02815 [Salpingoeca rosetta]EGD82141.1 hypothetical protein PTSG_02815 [Salpingoeca rosetta]|eukprot:XP_004996324.1 hypothetical protein PTSG_02815 [Salpingoeca rosetta]
MTCRAGRAVVHRFICARHNKAEEAVAAFPLGAYGHLGPACVHMTVHRTNASGVCQPRHAATPCPTNSVPLPTLAQQRYQRHEIVGLTHFNMATFVHNGDPACSSTNWNQGVNCSNPAVFNPVKLDIDNWIASYKALGAKHAVLTAKHGCGFLLWSTNTSLPNGRPYGYGVQRPNVPSFPRDVVLEFSTKMQAAGLGHGFYYSTGNNFYLNRIDFKPAGALLPGQVVNVTDKEYNTLVFEHVRELWSRYGNLTEIWFDHGYAGDQKAALQQLLQQYQPHAAGFNGYGIMPSPVKWCGTESGTPPRGFWSTGCDASSGNPNATSYCPTGVDTTLQDFDTWFWMPGVPIRSLGAMMDVYHASVGNNGVLELDFAINRDGLVDATHAVLYKQLGDWIRACYGTPLANASATGTTVTLTFQQPVTTDRFMLQEAFESGERVRTWRIDVQEKNHLQQMRQRHEGEYAPRR